MAEPDATRMEVFCVGAVISVLPEMLRRVVSVVTPANERNSRLAFVVEFCTVFLPMLVLMGGVARAEDLFCPTMTVLAAWGGYRIATIKPDQALEALEGMTVGRLRYLDAFRGEFMLATCVAILAVDFEIFPRQFAKSTDYGTSVMDVGPGGIVFAGGLVSTFSQPTQQTKLRQARCLFLVGMLRLAATSATRYQVEANEYGRHWNFFFTLAAVAVFQAFNPLPLLQTVVLAMAVLTGYQAALSSGVGPLLHSDDRDGNFFRQNKEGLCSILGYWSLYCLGSLCSWILSRTAAYCRDRLHGPSSPLQKGRAARKWLMIWWLGVALFTALLFALAHLWATRVDDVSRRTCNGSYVFWMAAYHTCQCLWKISLQLLGSRPNLLSRSVNRNLFGVFLLANFLTGLVNLSTETHERGAATAYLILCVYAAVLCYAADLADRSGLYLKL